MLLLLSKETLFHKFGAHNPIILLACDLSFSSEVDYYSKLKSKVDKEGFSDIVDYNS